MTKIVFIHGLCGSKNNFRNIRKHFPDTDAFDLPGYGELEHELGPFTTERYVAFLESKIRQKCILVGHSMGAILAKEFALAHPELIEKLILIGYPMQRDEKMMRYMLSLRPLGRLYVRPTLLGRLLVRIHWLIMIPILLYAIVFRYRDYPTYRDWFRHRADTVHEAFVGVILRDDWRTMASIRDKIVFITGQYDPYVDQSLLKDFKSVVIKGEGHTLINRQDEVADEIKKIIEK